MGITQPGGAGTSIFIYDDAVATNHPAAPGPHTAAEINAAFPVDFAIMQDAAANTFSAARRQYLLNVPVVHGGQATDGGNLTTWTDTLIDLFARGTVAQPNLRWRNDAGISPTNIVTNFGTKIGTGVKMSGKNGVSIHCLNIALQIRGTLGFYAGHIEGQGGIQFRNSGSTQQEIAGSVIDAAGSLILGDADLGPLTFYNCAISYRGAGNAMTSAAIADSSGVILSATAPNAFLASAAANRKIRRLTLNGAVGTADLVMSSGAVTWEATDVTWSDTVGKPRVSQVNDLSTANGLTDYRSYDTKVVDHAGNSLQAIPIFLTSDIDGPILDTQTAFDGNVVFTWAPTGVTGVLPVREYYKVSGVLSVRDRTYTLWVNSYMGAFPPNPNFDTRRFVFEWPGRDRLGSGYQTDGGTFQKVMDVIQLPAGVPTKVTQWDDCDVAGP